MDKISVIEWTSRNYNVPGFMSCGKDSSSFKSLALRYSETLCFLLSLLEYGSGAGAVVRLCREPHLVSNLSVVDADLF